MIEFETIFQLVFLGVLFGITAIVVVFVYFSTDWDLVASRGVDDK